MGAVGKDPFSAGAKDTTDSLSHVPSATSEFASHALFLVLSELDFLQCLRVCSAAPPASTEDCKRAGVTPSMSAVGVCRHMPLLPCPFKYSSEVCSAVLGGWSATCWDDGAAFILFLLPSPALKFLLPGITSQRSPLHPGPCLGAQGSLGLPQAKMSPCSHTTTCLLTGELSAQVGGQRVYMYFYFVIFIIFWRLLHAHTLCWRH